MDLPKLNLQGLAQARNRLWKVVVQRGEEMMKLVHEVEVEVRMGYGVSIGILSV